MKLIGNPNGMKLYPKMIKEAEPTYHMYGSDVTWSAHTDTYKPTIAGHGVNVEFLGFKHNLQMTILISPSTDAVYEKEIRDVLETGRFSSGIYFRAFLADIQGQVDFYRSITGKDASFWSYGNGIVDHDDFVMQHSLVTRKSGGGAVDYNFDNRLSRNCATIFNYNVRDNGMESAMTTAETMIQSAIDNGGWFNDFSHWHWADVHGDKNQFELFFGQQKDKLDTVNYVSLGSGEAVEYMWLRKLYKRGGIYQDGNDLVLISDVRNDVKLPFNAIDTTLSVELDLTGTILEGKEVSSSVEILKVDANKYIVQVPYSKRDGFRSVRLRETLEPKYLDLSLPIVNSATMSGDILSVTTDKPTNIVIFSVPSGGELYQAEIISRSNTMENDHEVEVGDVSGKDVYIGAITSSRQSILHKLV